MTHISETHLRNHARHSQKSASHETCYMNLPLHWRLRIFPALAGTHSSYTHVNMPGMSLSVALSSLSLSRALSLSRCRLTKIGTFSWLVWHRLGLFSDSFYAWVMFGVMTHMSHVLYNDAHESCLVSDRLALVSDSFDMGQASCADSSMSHVSYDDTHESCLLYWHTWDTWVMSHRLGLCSDSFNVGQACFLLYVWWGAGMGVHVKIQAWVMSLILTHVSHVSYKDTHESCLL